MSADALQYTPGKYEISRRENRCILKIKNADRDDGAEFKCEVEGDQTSCKVNIEGDFQLYFVVAFVRFSSTGIRSCCYLRYKYVVLAVLVYMNKLRE